MPEDIHPSAGMHACETLAPNSFPFESHKLVGMGDTSLRCASPSQVQHLEQTETVCPFINRTALENSRKHTRTQGNEHGRVVVLS